MERMEINNEALVSEVRSVVHEIALKHASMKDTDKDQIDLEAVTAARKLRETFPGQEEQIKVLLNDLVLGSDPDKGEGFDRYVGQKMVQAIDYDWKDVEPDEKAA